MRILFISTRFPYPPVKGDQVVTYNCMRALSSRHQIFLLCLNRSQDQLRGIPELELFCEKICTVRLPRWRSRLNLGLALFSRLPAHALYYHSISFRAQAARIIREHRIDVVHAVMLRTAPAVDGLDVPVLLDLVDSMQLLLERMLSTAKGLLRVLIRMELARVKTYEKRASARFPAVTVVSSIDQAVIGEAQVQVIPLGVDLNDFVPQPALRAAAPTVMFTGNMSYAPNVEAVNWFAKNCWPEIQACLPTARLLIVGKNPSRSVRALGKRAGVEVCGFVPSMAEWINRAWVCIAPMQSGSGMQNKILQAMACGVPVITTTLGLADIKAAPGIDLLVADKPGDYAKAVMDLLNGPGLAAEIGGRGLDFVRRHHSWEAVSARFEQLYAGLMAEDLNPARTSAAKTS